MDCSSIVPASSTFVLHHLHGSVQRWDSGGGDKADLTSRVPPPQRSDIMVQPTEEIDYFATMGLAPGATEAEIRRAHKKLSLALHPDKNRHMDATLAAARFSEMQLAYEVLMDPSARLAAAERNKTETARKERRGAYEGKRKAMAEELEKREDEERQKRYTAAQEERRRTATLERLREEGKRLREERERATQQQQQQQQQQRQQRDRPAQMTQDEGSAQNHINPTLATEEATTPSPDLGPLDLTVTLRFPASQYTELAASSSSGVSAEDPLQSRLAVALTSRFGKLDSLLFRAPKSESKPHRERTAHATFITLDAAFAAVKAGSQLLAGGTGDVSVLEDVWIGWAAAPRKGKSAAASEEKPVPVQDDPAALPGEPVRIAWMRSRGLLNRQPAHTSTTSSPREKETHGDAPAPALNESDVLQRLAAGNVGKPQNSAIPLKRQHGETFASPASSSPIKSSFPSFSFGGSGASPAPHHRDPPVSSTQRHHANGTNGCAQPSASLDFESATLRKLREAERRRVEDAIRRANE